MMSANPRMIADGSSFPNNANAGRRTTSVINKNKNVFALIACAESALAM